MEECIVWEREEVVDVVDGIVLQEGGSLLKV